MHWILILTLWGVGRGAIHSINFDTKEACEVAAKQWLKHFPEESVPARGAICVPQDHRNKEKLNERVKAVN